MTQSPMVQPTIPIQKTPQGRWVCIVPRASTPFLIPYLRRRGLEFTARPEGALDHFEFPGDLTLSAMKAIIRGFGARVPRADELDTD